LFPFTFRAKKRRLFFSPFLPLQIRRAYAARPYAGAFLRKMKKYFSYAEAGAGNTHMKTWRRKSEGPKRVARFWRAQGLSFAHTLALLWLHFFRLDWNSRTISRVLRRSYSTSSSRYVISGKARRSVKASHVRPPAPSLRLTAECLQDTHQIPP
jgi:hypothetical protein